MNLNITSIDKKWKTAGLIAIGAGLLVYPAIRAYKYFTAKRNASAEGDGAVVKHFTPSYRGNHKPHHRKALNNGRLA